MRRLADSADDQRRSRQPVGWCYEFNPWHLCLEEDVAGYSPIAVIISSPLGEPIEQLDAGIERMRILLGKLFPEARPIQLTQRVPLYELQNRRRKSCS